MVAAVPRGLEDLRFAMLWLLTYVFLLRLPSEVRGLSCCAGHCAMVVPLLRRACPLAEARPRPLWLPSSSLLFGAMVSTFACGFCGERTGHKAVASSAVRAVVLAARVHAQCTCYGIVSSQTLLSARNRGLMSPPAWRGSVSARCCVTWTFRMPSFMEHMTSGVVTPRIFVNVVRRLQRSSLRGSGSQPPS